MNRALCPDCSHPWSSHFSVIRLAEKYGCQGRPPIDRGTLKTRPAVCGCQSQPPKISCSACIILGKRCSECIATERAMT